MTSPPTGKRLKVPGPFRYQDLPAGVVYVGRATLGYPSSPYHNPFKPAAKTPDAHAATVQQYRQHLRRHPELIAGIRRDIPAGTSVACWCPDGWPCHGDVVLEVSAGAEP